LDTARPYIGASPDGLVSCSCCGDGVLEVKCPFSVKDKFPENDQASFCMRKVDNSWVLKQDHEYFYQVQTQMHVCKRDYCDFVVWSEKDGIIIDRIEVNKEFFDSIVELLQTVFIYGILPEIIGKWYSRQPISNFENIVEVSELSANVEVDEEDYEKLWCYCNMPSYGQMIFCDHNNCTIQWFHCDCLRIRKIPKGSWKCPSCRKLPKTQNSKKN